MSYISTYKSFLRVGKKVSRNTIQPRNIYKIQSYEGGNPNIKTGLNERYVFVVSKVGKYLHCLEMKQIDPTDFFNFLKRIKQPRVPIEEGKPLNEIIRKFTLDGKSLFNNYIKPNSKIYIEGKESNYRTYLLKNIRLCYELNFEADFLDDVLNESRTTSTTRDMVDKESTELD